MSRSRRFLQRIGPYQGPLSAYCSRLLWSPADLEDALQETLTVAFRDFCDPPEDELRAWVFRVATWTCFNLNRRHGRELPSGDAPRVPQAVVDTLERECAYEEILADPAAAFESLGDELARACRRLTEKERAIFLLKSLGGLTCAEIARSLDLPLGTAQGLLTRARHKLREHLTDLARARGRSSPGRLR